MWQRAAWAALLIPCCVGWWSWDSAASMLDEPVRMCAAKNVSVVIASVDDGLSAFRRYRHRPNPTTLRPWTYPVLVMCPVFVPRNLWDFSNLAESPFDFEQFSRRLAVVIDMQFEVTGEPYLGFERDCSAALPRYPVDGLGSAIDDHDFWNAAAGDVGPLQVGNVVNGLFGCLGGLLSGFDRSLHVGGLLGGISLKEPHLAFAGPIEPSRGDYEGEREERDRSGERHEPPVGRRFLAAILSLFGGFFCSFRGWKNLYEERRFKGAAWFAGGCLLMLFGMGLWWVIGFRETWGWPV